MGSSCSTASSPPHGHGHPPGAAASTGTWASNPTSARIASTTNTSPHDAASEETAIETFDKEDQMKKLKEDKRARDLERSARGDGDVDGRRSRESHRGRSKERNRDRSRERGAARAASRDKKRNKHRSRERHQRRDEDGDEIRDSDDSDDEGHRHTRKSKGSPKKSKSPKEQKRRHDEHGRSSSPPLQFIQPNHIDHVDDTADDADMEVIDVPHTTTNTNTNNNPNAKSSPKNQNNNNNTNHLRPNPGLFKKGLVDRNFAVESSNAELFVQLSRDRLKHGLPAQPQTAGWT